MHRRVDKQTERSPTIISSFMRIHPPGSPIGGCVPATSWNVPRTNTITQKQSTLLQDSIFLHFSSGLGQYAGCDAALYQAPTYSCVSLDDDDRTPNKRLSFSGNFQV